MHEITIFSFALSLAPVHALWACVVPPLCKLLPQVYSKACLLHRGLHLHRLCNHLRVEETLILRTFVYESGYTNQTR